MSNKSKIAAVVLAAGKGTRMGDQNGSPIPKVMFEIDGKPMINYSIANLKKAGINEIITVVGYKKELIKSYLKNQVRYAIQEEQLGTGHAVMMARELVEEKCEGLLVCCGDAPFFRPGTIEELAMVFEKEHPTIAMLSTHFANPTGYGRIVRDRDGKVKEIIEQKDCTEDQMAITEGNPSFYIFDNDWFWKNIDKLKSDNSQHEYYLTDMIDLAKKQGKTIIALPTEDESEAAGINTPEQLKQAKEILKTRIASDLKLGDQAFSPNY